jgi:glutathione peroxidase
MSLYGIETKTLEGQPSSLSAYQGKVTLIVNVASECGYTRQYAGLQRLHDRYQAQEFSVLGFPSNEFGGQEPGSPEQIREFCSTRFKVTFPLFEKVKTKAGSEQSSIYAALHEGTGRLPSWNFGKYLVSRAGEVLEFFPHATEPEAPALVAALEKALASQG